MKKSPFITFGYDRNEIYVFYPEGFTAYSKDIKSNGKH